jgi:ATP-dependent DNA helicase PIF1
VMLMRNLEQGLCNGTRLIIIKIERYIMEGNVVTRSNIGDKVYIHILSLPPSDIRILFKFQHRQFPIYVCFAMTINKSQGQPLKQVGIYLLQPVFSDSQLFL